MTTTREWPPSTCVSTRSKWRRSGRPRAGCSSPPKAPRPSSAVAFKERPTPFNAPRPPPSLDATRAPTQYDDKGENTSDETGHAGAVSAECFASALALAQRVRDLGLHLGDVVVSGVSAGLPNGESAGCASTRAASTRCSAGRT